MTGLGFLMLVVVAIFLIVVLLSSGGGSATARDCHQCGARHPDHASFCRRCGRELR